MEGLKILFAASEAAPFARTGGLGDVIGALPQALAKLGHTVRVFMPGYSASGDTGGKRNAVKADLRVDNQTQSVTATRLTTRSSVSYWFVENDEFFARPGLYQDPRTGEDYPDNIKRFSFFCRSVLKLCEADGWVPDVIHVHDWQAGLIPVYLKNGYVKGSPLSDVPVVLTIHNLGYQGVFERNEFSSLELPAELMYAMTGSLEFYGKVNLLKGGIVCADAITTVSRTYAREIQADETYGFGLEGVLKDRSADITGIVNGVDYTVWSPSRDKLIPYRYNMANLSGKRANKVELMNLSGLPLREKTPLVGMVTRLTAQKGLDLVLEVADQLFDLDLQMVILGTGDPKIEEALLKLAQKYPTQLKVYTKFDNHLAHLIEAGADVFLMPSKYEPCGLNQLYSLKYGTVPVVRATGGLADTVAPYDPDDQTGTGFVFEGYESEELLEQMAAAVELYPKRRRWVKLMKNGMKKDFSWKASASHYEQLYGSLVAK